jgi:poly(3-hydroxybutyrate) depolymerase
MRTKGIRSFANWLLLPTIFGSLLAAGTLPAMGATVNDFTARVFTNAQNVRLPYRLFVPSNYVASARYPLVTFLHGSGERGTDNRLQVNGQAGFLDFISLTNQQRHPMFLLAPQCPVSGAWAEDKYLEAVHDLVTIIGEEFSVDSDRLYITGLSMGGFGSFGLLTRYPEMFAAAVPMSSGWDPAYAPVFSDVALWNFHAVNDSSVGVGNSRVVIDGMRIHGGKPIYTEYATGGHVIWTVAYKTPGLLDWLMDQRRGEKSKGGPQVTISNLEPRVLPVTRSANLGLDGTAEFRGRNLNEIRWTNYRTGGSGAAPATNSFSFTNIALRPLAHNHIVVTASTADGHAPYGGTTSFNESVVLYSQPGVALQIQAQTAAVILRTPHAISPVRIESSSNLVQWRTVITNAEPFAISSVELRDGSEFFRARELDGQD